MPFKPLTEEQFNKARQAGYTLEQIIEFEKRRKQEQETQRPEISQQQFQTLWQKLGAEITPEMEQTYPYQSAIAKTGQEVSVAPAHFINQLLLNLPRAIAYKAGIQYPEAETLPGQILSKGAGIGGAITSPVGKAISGLAKLPTGAGLGIKMLQGAKIGALGGAAYTPTEDILGLQQRALQTTGGALLGGLFVGASEGIQKGVREFRKFKIQAKPSIKERLGYQIKDVRQAAQKEMQNIQIANNEAKNVIIDNIKILDDDLQKAAETGSTEFQKRLPIFFRNNSEAYGQRLNDISKKIGKRFTRGEANEILQNTLNELDEALITEGKPRQIIEYLNNKYALSKMVETKIILPTGKWQYFSPDTPINFKEFKADIQSVSKALSTQIKAGERFTQEDIASAILNKNLGEYISKVAPEFKELQAAYRPVIQSMKLAGRIFKPYAGELETKAGTQFLKRAGLGKLEAGEEKLLQMIQEGSEFAKGIGEISKPVKEIGKSIAEKKQALKNLNMLRQLATEKLKEKQTQRLFQLEQRRRKISELLANKEKAQQFRKILLGTSGVGAFGLGAYLLRRKLGNILMRD